MFLVYYERIFPHYYALADTEVRVYFNMVKVRELSENEQVAIKVLCEAGHSFAKIARQVGCSKSGAFKFFRSIEKSESFAKLPITGRPKIFFERGERAICRIARKLRFATLGELKPAACAQFPEENPSKYLVRRILRKNGLKRCKRKQKPFISKNNRSYRVTWAKTLLEWPLTHWNDVIFSDESRFCLQNDSGVSRVWRTAGEAENPLFFLPKFVNTVSVMVWGCIGPNGLGKLTVCERSVNSKYYQEILQQNLKESVEIIYGVQDHPFIFQQDNAPCHTAIATKNYLNRMGIMLLPWPSQSPDLNIIEKIWQYMKIALNNDPPKNKQQLIEKIFQIWRKVPKKFIRNLYASIPRRLLAVKKSRGYPTKY